MSKFKNKHFLLITGIICFITFYVPIKFFTEYSAYIPEWTLPIFIVSTTIPIWIHEFLWRTASFASDSYLAFHDLHFEDKKWLERTCNPFYFLRNYFLWLCSRPIFWIMSLLLLTSLFLGFTLEYDENQFHPFLPFYVSNSIWWIGVIKDFVVFRNDAKEGLISYRLPQD